MPTPAQDHSTTMVSGARRVPVPATRDPFINTPLLPLSPDAAGLRRYWTSTYNSAAGCIGVLVDELGRSRVYRFGPPHSGFYSAAQGDDDTLWLCGDLSRVVRLTLSNGDVEVFPTGAPEGLVFRGMAHDLERGKLYAAALGSGARSSLAFDYRNRVTAVIHHDVTDNHYTKASFANGDGTHTLLVCTPGLSLLTWDPTTDAISASAIEAPGPESFGWAELSRLDRVIADDHGRRYLSAWGWFDPASGSFVDGPRPDREMTWFGRIEGTAWGIESDGSIAEIGRWDMETGVVDVVFRIPDLTADGVALTDEGKILAVTIYGEFLRHDARTGALELTRRFDSDAPGLVYHVRRISEDRLIGAPFITQRFWDLRLSDGTGTDLGRAAPGAGEVKLSWSIGGKVYFAAYVGGRVTEYSPDQPARFPENPRLVADTPGALRPTAGTDDGSRLYFACSRDVGKTGCTLTRYDTATGLATYVDDPVAGLAIRSLVRNAPRGGLIAGTSVDGDNLSAERILDRSAVLWLDSETLQVTDRLDLDASVNEVTVIGAVDDFSHLCVAQTDDGRRRFFVLSAVEPRIPELDEMTTLAESTREILPTARPGIFARRIGTRIELWDVAADRAIRTIADDPAIDRFFVQDDSAYLVMPTELIVIEPLVEGQADV